MSKLATLFGRANLELNLWDAALGRKRQATAPFTTKTSRPSSQARRTSGNVQLCCPVDRHECEYSHLLARECHDRGRHELEAGVFTVFLGNVLVLIPMLLNAHAGAQYGIPFPVFARSALEYWARMFRQCCGRSWPAAGLAFRPGLAVKPSTP